MAMFNAAEFFNMSQPFHEETKKQYEKIHKIIQKGDPPCEDHGDCVLQPEWSYVATELYNRTCQWIDRNPNFPNINHRAAKEIRLNNKTRLEYIIIRAASKYDELKFEICMDLLHITLAHELIAIHHLDMIVQEQVNRYREELNDHYRSLVMWDQVNPSGANIY